MSLFSLAARSSSSVRSDRLTGVTNDTCLPTGQRCTLHQLSRIDFTETPGTQIVVNRWPRRHRTTTSPAGGYPRRFSTTISGSTLAATMANRRARDL